MTERGDDSGARGDDQAQPAASSPFEWHRHRLVRVGFHILRSVPDSEDVVQDAWLRWHRSRHTELANPAAFLTTVVTNLSLDRLRRVRARHETPLDDHGITGRWITDDRRNDPQMAVETATSVAEALWLLLQRLSPLERSAIVLRDVFGLPYADVARRLGRTEPAARQLVSRGRHRLRHPVTRYAAAEVTHARAVRAFRAVCNGGDLAPLLEALTPEMPNTAAAHLPKSQPSGRGHRPQPRVGDRPRRNCPEAGHGSESAADP